MTVSGGPTQLLVIADLGAQETTTHRDRAAEISDWRGLDALVVSADAVHDHGVDVRAATIWPAPDPMLARE